MGAIYVREWKAARGTCMETGSSWRFTVVRVAENQGHLIGESL